MNELQKIMELTGTSTDVELAEVLGFSGSGTISNWKKRGKVPIKNIRQWAKKYGKSVEYFTDELEQKNTNYSPIEEAIIGKVKSLTDAQQGEAYALLAKHFSDELKREKS